MSQTLLRRKRFDEGLGEDPERHMTTIYVRFLQGLFNFMPQNHFHWEPDLEHTEIVITAEAPLEKQVVEKAPVITVVLGPTQWQGLSIDNMLSLDPHNNKRQRTDLCTGYFAVYCVAGNDVVARRIAQAVANHTRMEQRLLEGPGGFHQIARPGPSINSPSPPGSLVNGDVKGLVMVQVNIPFTFQWTWQTTPSRQAPQQQSLAMILQEERAVDYPYSSPSTVETVRLAISTRPLTVRRINKKGYPPADVVEVGTPIEQFQLSVLNTFPSEE